MANAVSTGVDRPFNRLLNPAFRRFYTAPEREEIITDKLYKAVYNKLVSPQILVKDESRSLAAYTITAERARIVLNPQDLDLVPIFPPYGQALLVESLVGGSLTISQRIEEPGPLIGSSITLSIWTKGDKADLGWRQGIRNDEGVVIRAEELHSSHNATFIQHTRTVDVPETWTSLEWFLDIKDTGSMFIAAPILALGQYSNPRFSDEYDQPEGAIVISLGDTCPEGFREVCEVRDHNLMGVVGDPDILLNKINVKSGIATHDHTGFTSNSLQKGDGAKKRASPRVISRFHKHSVSEADQTPPSMTYRICERL